MLSKQQSSRAIVALTLASVALLVACGGSTGSGPGPIPATPTPVSSPITTSGPQSTTTNASGVVVNDANGNPLAGVRVVLMPWAPCGATPAPAAITPENDGCPTPLPSPQATTNPTGQFVLNGAPNGHYLLVIGTDTVATPPPGYAPPTCTNACPTPSPNPFTVQATVHDNVTLTGGNQILHAPVLPPVPTITPPTWETNGDYRLATLDASTEMPCLMGWQYGRAQAGLAMGSVDEWLTEQSRAVNTAAQNPAASLNGFGLLTVGHNSNSGGTDCANSLVLPLVGTYATDPRTLWFFGQYDFYYPGKSTSAYGLAEFPIDPRSNTDPNAPTWP